MSIESRATLQEAIYVYEGPIRLWHWVNAFSVIDNLNDHAICLLRGANRNCAGFRFSLGPPDFRSLQAVIEAVSDNMNQRIRK